MGHEFFAEVSEDFIEDDFNLTGLQAQVPMYKEALEMILDVEPEEDDDEQGEDEEDEEEEEDEEDMLGEEKAPAYRKAGERRHARVASDLSVIESSAELLYGLIHQRYITSRPGIQQMLEKYDLHHFGFCPRSNCNGCRVLPVGRSDTPGLETVKLFCPSCQDIYTPPNSRFHSVDGAFFGTTFGCLFFMTFPYLDIAPRPDVAISPMSPGAAAVNPARQSPASSLTSSAAVAAASSTATLMRTSPPEEALPADQPVEINGVRTVSFCPGLGVGKVYEPRIYGFRVSERSRSGPRMRWLRMKPADIIDLDEATRYHELPKIEGGKPDHDGDTDMTTALAGSQQSTTGRRKLAPMRRRRPGTTNDPDQMSINGGAGG